MDLCKLLDQNFKARRTFFFRVENLSSRSAVAVRDVVKVWCLGLFGD